MITDSASVSLAGRSNTIPRFMVVIFYPKEVVLSTHLTPTMFGRNVLAVIFTG